MTVGISRSDETLLQVPLVQQVLAAGAARDNLSYRVLRTLVDLDAAVAEVTGYTRYRIEGDSPTDDATIGVLDQGGSAMPAAVAHRATTRSCGAPSSRCGRARGHGRPWAQRRPHRRDRPRGQGRPDRRADAAAARSEATVVPADVAHAVLSGYRNRYAALRGAFTETELSFDDQRLADDRPGRPAHRPGLRPRRPLARPPT